MKKVNLFSRRAIGAACVLAACSFASASAHGAVIASGTLAGSDGTLIPTSGNWANWANPVLNWSVELTGNIYTYTYAFDNGNTGGQANLSHMAIEVSDSFTLADLLSGTTVPFEFGYDGSSPHVDGTASNLFAVKWQADSGSFTGVIVTRRIPVWGDVFLKDGSVNGSNAGYVPADPQTPVSGLNITGYDWLAVPDSENIPSPAAGALLCIGGLAACRRRR